MKIYVLKQEQHLPVTPEEAWDFFSSPRNLDAITPPDLGFRILHDPEEKMHEGQIITYKVRIAPGIRVPWVTEIKAVEPPVAFVDEQRAGPYRFWHHRHAFEPVADGGVRMTDVVHYALPLGPVGSLVHALFVRRKLEWIFKCRKSLLAERFGSPSPESQR